MGLLAAAATDALTSSTPGSDLTLSVELVVLVVAPVAPAPPWRPNDADKEDEPPKGFWKS